MKEKVSFSMRERELAPLGSQLGMSSHGGFLRRNSNSCLPPPPRNAPLSTHRGEVNSLTPKSVPAGMKNSRLEGFLLAKHKHTNIPTMMEQFAPFSGMVLLVEHTLPPRASVEGVGQGRRRRDLVESIN